MSLMSQIISVQDCDFLQINCAIAICADKRKVHDDSEFVILIGVGLVRLTNSEGNRRRQQSATLLFIWFRGSGWSCTNVAILNYL